MHRRSENKRRSARKFGRGASKTRKANHMIRRGGFRL